MYGNCIGLFGGSNVLMGWDGIELDDGEEKRKGEEGRDERGKESEREKRS
jgi:hypothetical protein